MRICVIALLLAFFALAACGDGRQGTEDSVRAASIVESSAERMSSELHAMRGNPLVVNYWATWCEPCKREMPLLVEAARRYEGRVSFLGVNVEDDLAAAADFARRYRIPFRSLAMSKIEVQRNQNILGLPVTQFYSADGELAFVHQGEIKASDLREKIEDLVRLGRPIS